MEAPQITQVKEIARKLHAGVGLEDLVIVIKLDAGFYAMDDAHDDVTYMREGDLEEYDALISAVFDDNPKVVAVMRARSPYSQKVAAAYEAIPPVLDDMAQIVGVTAPVVDVSARAKIKKALFQGNGCLLKDGEVGVGSLAVGTSILQAAAALLVLEKSAKVFWEARALGGAKPLGRGESFLMHQVFKRRYSQMESNATHQSKDDLPRKIDADELALRKAMVKAGKEMREKNLVQGTWGNISVQLDDRFMLVTPSGLEYDLLTPYDIVRVDMQTLQHEGALAPTSEKAIHAELLKAHDDVRSVIHTHPVNGSTFAAARRPLMVTKAADRALLGGDVAVAAYGLPGSKKLAKGVIAAVADNRAVIMENHGVLVCGNALDDALVKCELVEDLATQRIAEAEPG